MTAPKQLKKTISRKRQRRFLLSILILLFAWPAFAFDFVVIANVNSGLDKMSKDDVINIYMGRYRQLPSGIPALPLDIANPASEKAKFYAAMVGKEVAEINSYWARLKFSGQGSAPRQTENMEEALDIVSKNKGALAYVDKRWLEKSNKRIKVVFDPSP